MSQSGFEHPFLMEQLTIGHGATTPVRMAEGVYHVRALGNAGFIITPDGVVVIDTGNPVDPKGFMTSLRSITQERICFILYTHGHVDHAGNALPLLEEADQRGDPRPRILAHRLVEKRFARYAKTRRLQDSINRIQFALPAEHSGWPADEAFVYPDETYDEHMNFQLGGISFELFHGYGETDDATWIYIPEREVIFSGDLFISSCPNSGNPLKIQRYDIEWAEALERMAEKKAVVLGPGHGDVVYGKERIQDALLTTATALRYLHDAVIERLNAGQWQEQICEEVKLPERLASHWAMSAIYGCPEFIIRGICSRHRGWYDGNPSHLFPSPAAQIAREVVELCGQFTLFTRASQLVDDSHPQMALHVLDFLLNAPNVSHELRMRAEDLKGQALLTLSKEASSFIAKNIYISPVDTDRRSSSQAICSRLADIPREGYS